MSYFNLSTGAAPETNGNFELGGGEILPIPKNTIVKAISEEVKWDSFNDDPEFISIAWTIADGEYKNRKIFQKIRVNDTDPAKSDKAIMMLSAILANAGHNIASLTGKPTSEQLMQMIQFKPMFLKLGVWEMNDKKGNWVQAVSKEAVKKIEGEAPKVAQAADQDDDLPF